MVRVAVTTGLTFGVAIACVGKTRSTLMGACTSIQDANAGRERQY